MTPIKIYDKPLNTLPALVAAIDAGELDATFEALGSADGTASGARGRWDRLSELGAEGMGRACGGLREYCSIDEGICQGGGEGGWKTRKMLRKCYCFFFFFVNKWAGRRW